MDTRKLFLYGALFFVCLSLWSAWQTDYPSSPAVNGQQQAETVQHPGTKQLSTAVKTQPTTSTYKAAAADELIHVTNDVLDLTINKRGGDIISAKLRAYPEDVNQPHTPIALLHDKAGQLYIAKSGIEASQTKIEDTIQYQSAEKNYRLSAGKKELVVELTGVNKQGIAITKTLTLTQGSYLVNISYQVHNPTKQPWSGYLYSRFLQNEPTKAGGGFFGISSYTGAAVSDPKKKLYEKLSYSTMQKGNLKRNVDGGWIALQQHYFITAWIPPSEQVNHYLTHHDQNSLYTVGIMSPIFTVEPQQTHTTSTQLYVGPEIADTLKTIAPGLDFTIDYGWLWYFSLAIFWLMKHIYSIVGNWGWSIVLVTLIIKILFYKLSSTSYRSMANMRKLQPRIQAIRERYGDDKQKLSMATMELYKKEKINPFGGCWPILIQIPVFIALYWVLLESVELRQAPFILWIRDLSIADPYYVLPLLMGGTMFIQQLLNPPPPDPVQAKMMMLLPLFFTFLFLHFPAGLVLYWVVNNGVSILQQWYITHKFELEEKQLKVQRR